MGWLLVLKLLKFLLCTTWNTKPIQVKGVIKTKLNSMNGA